MLGVVVNIVAAWTLAKANRSSLTVEDAFQQIVAKLYGLIATLIAGIIIVATEFTRADSIATYSKHATSKASTTFMCGP